MVVLVVDAVEVDVLVDVDVDVVVVVGGTLVVVVGVLVVVVVAAVVVVVVEVDGAVVVVEVVGADVVLVVVDGEGGVGLDEEHAAAFVRPATAIRLSSPTRARFIDTSSQHRIHCIIWGQGDKGTGGQRLRPARG